MSNAAINAAYCTRTGRAVDKFILVTLANYADEYGICFPSQAKLISDTELDRKTVMAGIKRLIDAGVLVDTGARRGSTGQIIVYRVPVEAPPGCDQRVPDFPSNGPIFPAEEVHISRQGSQIRATEPPEPPKGTPIEPPRRERAGSVGNSGGAQLALLPTEKPRSSGLVNGKLDAFQEFWNLYPPRLEHGKMVKPGKWAAEQAFAAAIRRVDPQVIIVAVKNFPFPENPKYIQAPENWLKAGNFEAEFAPVDPADTDPFAALNRMHAEAARDGEYDGITIDAELEEYPHG